MDSGALVADLHGRVLRLISLELGVHFEGLRSAAAICRRRRLLSSQAVKRLERLDHAFALTRHITAPSAAEFLRGLAGELASGLGPGSAAAGAAPGRPAEVDQKTVAQTDKVQVPTIQVVNADSVSPEPMMEEELVHTPVVATQKRDNQQMELQSDGRQAPLAGGAPVEAPCPSSPEVIKKVIKKLNEHAEDLLTEAEKLFDEDNVEEAKVKFGMYEGVKKIAHEWNRLPNVSGPSGKPHPGGEGTEARRRLKGKCTPGAGYT